MGKPAKVGVDHVLVELVVKLKVLAWCPDSTEAASIFSHTSAKRMPSHDGSNLSIDNQHVSICQSMPEIVLHPGVSWWEILWQTRTTLQGQSCQPVETPWDPW